MQAWTKAVAVREEKKMNARVTAETIDLMPKHAREGEMEDEENFPSLEFSGIGTINQDREGGGAKELWRDDNGLCFGYEEFEVLSTCCFFGCW